MGLPDVDIICIDGRVGKEYDAWDLVKRCLTLMWWGTQGHAITWRERPIRSLQEYSEFCIKELAKHMIRKHCLIVQEDGYIIRPHLWNPLWLNFDYIGAPWGDGVVGNGGFSLRSRRLME